MKQAGLRLKVSAGCFVLGLLGCFGSGDGAGSSVAARYAVAQDRVFTGLCECNGVCVSRVSQQCGADLIARHADVIEPWAECAITVYDAFAECLDEESVCSRCMLGDLDQCGELPPAVAVEVSEDDPPPGPYADCIAEAEGRDECPTGGCGPSSGSDPGFSGGSSLACPLELIGQMSVPGSATDPCDQTSPACADLGGVAVNCCLPSGNWQPVCTCMLPGSSLTCGPNGIIDATESLGVGCSGSGTAPSSNGIEICEISCSTGVSATCTRGTTGPAMCFCTQGPRTGQQFEAAGCPLETSTLMAACGP